MAFSSSSSIQMTVSDEEFCCPLCLGIVEEPKSLPGCAHNFCRSCLHEMLIGTNNTLETIPCPVCRVPSKVPANGADGFPTNTLLVRLLDNIPGRKEKKELLKAVASCKEKIENSRKCHDDIERQCSVIQRNKELAEDLKTQVSDYAKETIEGIQNCEQVLCREIDVFLHQKCGLSSETNLDMSKKIIHTFLEDASNCVYNVEDILKQDVLSEILNMKTMIVEQLGEYSNFPGTVSASSKGISAFDLEFEKNNIEEDNVFGKILSRRVSANGTYTGSARSEPETGLSLNFTEAEEESNYALASYDLAAQQHPPEDTQGDIVSTVNLTFEPFRIAVSPRSGDVAVLCKENNRVYLYDTNGSDLGIINVKFGDLWDVGFSIDDVVVVNRENNRLLFYTKESQFIGSEVKEVPRSDLKYTYLSVCNDGRLIVTSALVDYEGNDDDYDDDEEVVQCIIVYDADDDNCKMMFGRKHLKKPVSRAVLHNGRYYIADGSDQSNVYYIKIFSSQGQLVGSIEDPQQPCCVPLFISIFKDTGSNRLLIGGGYPKKKWMGYSGSVYRSCNQYRNNIHIQQQEMLPKSFYSGPHRGMLQVEIYKGQQILNIVHYH